MGIEVRDDGVALIDGMTPAEFSATTGNPTELEAYVAQKCPDSYVTGLKIGTMLIKAPGSISNFEEGYDGYTAWSKQKTELELQSPNLIDDEGVWSSRALNFGTRAGIDQPMRKFKVEGVIE